jgi:hypothetical protein
MTENNYLKHFKKELEILEAGLAESDNLVIKDFIPEIESIAEKFSKQGHSGGSAPLYAATLSSTIKKVLLFKPLSPLTGEASEWGHTSHGVWQNNRLSRVFKNGENSQPYYLDAIVWSGEEEYDTFTGVVEGIRSRQYIKLPFTPKTFYVDVVKCDDGVYKIKDRKQLKEVFEYYDEFEFTEPTK